MNDFLSRHAETVLLGDRRCIEAEVLANAVWRRGRLFVRCRACHRPATRLYVPVEGAEPRCRRCWGLNYESQSWSYAPCGPLAFLGPLAYATTDARRKARKDAARARYLVRRSL